MTPENLSLSEIGGATAKSLSVPQLDPIFSYPVSGGGDIYVYLVKSAVGKFAIITYDNTSVEHAFAVQTLTSNSEYEAHELVRNAEKAAIFFVNNPFTQLYEDPEAMAKLAVILARFFDGEWNDGTEIFGRTR